MEYLHVSARRILKYGAFYPSSVESLGFLCVQGCSSLNPCGFKSFARRLEGFTDSNLQIKGQGDARAEASSLVFKIGALISSNTVLGGSLLKPYSNH